ncbi:MAG: hypothetical protein AABY22_24650 [Nanoarchaeota archaeon]
MWVKYIEKKPEKEGTKICLSRFGDRYFANYAYGKWYSLDGQGYYGYREQYPAYWLEEPPLPEEFQEKKSINYSI